MEAMPVLFTIIMGQATNDNKDKNNGQCTTDKKMDLNERLVQILLSVSEAFFAPVVQSLFIRSLPERGISKGAVILPDVDHLVGWDKGVKVSAMMGAPMLPDLDMLEDQAEQGQRICSNGMDVIEGNGPLDEDKEGQKICSNGMDVIEDNGPLHDDKDKKMIILMPTDVYSEWNQNHQNGWNQNHQDMIYSQSVNVNLMLKDVNRKSPCDDPNMMLPNEKLDALCQEDNEDSHPNEDLLVEVVLGALGVRDDVPDLFNDLIPVPVPVVAVRDGGDVPGGGEEEDHAEEDVAPPGHHRGVEDVHHDAEEDVAPPGHHGGVEDVHHDAEDNEVEIDIDVDNKVGFAEMKGVSHPAEYDMDMIYDQWKMIYDQWKMIYDQWKKQLIIISKYGPPYF